MRKISVLLTKYSDWISIVIYHLGGRGFTHSSIALEENQDIYYSFNYRGFAVETTEKYRRRGVRNSRCIQLQIPDESYDYIREQLKIMAETRDRYSYTKLGVLFCICRFPFNWQNHYFCSQFVAELLVNSGAVELRRRPCLYLPNHFASELPELSSCSGILCNVV